MALKSILRIRRRHPEGRSSTETEGNKEAAASAATQRTVSKADIRRATRIRRGFVIATSLAYLLSWIFLVLVLIGNTSDKPVLRDSYFFKLDLANIIPASVPNAVLVNSIARSIGLHDFYQVGLWNFCEGYIAEGITYCSTPQNLYWFNPVEIIMSELLSGATIAIPTQVLQILDILRIVSQIMFGFFITGCVVTFVLIFASWLALSSRWLSLPLAIVCFINFLLVVAASIIASAISFVFKYAAESQSDLNIHVDMGTRMLVFMWLATGFSLFAFIVHAGMGCCCTSRRDVESGRKPIRRSATPVSPESDTT